MGKKSKSAGLISKEAANRKVSDMLFPYLLYWASVNPLEVISHREEMLHTHHSDTVDGNNQEQVIEKCAT